MEKLLGQELQVICFMVQEELEHIGKIIVVEWLLVLCVMVMDSFRLVAKPCVLDVAVDIRSGSPTRGKWFGAELSDENRRMLFIPRGFAHGFLVLSDIAEFAYKCDDLYHPGDDGGLRFNDPAIGIEWPDSISPEEMNINDRDRNWPDFAHYKKEHGMA